MIKKFPGVPTPAGNETALLATVSALKHGYETLIGVPKESGLQVVTAGDVATTITPDLDKIKGMLDNITYYIDITTQWATIYTNSSKSTALSTTPATLIMDAGEGDFSYLSEDNASNQIDLSTPDSDVAVEVYVFVSVSGTGNNNTYTLQLGVDGTAVGNGLSVKLGGNVNEFVLSGLITKDIADTSHTFGLMLSCSTNDTVDVDSAILTVKLVRGVGDTELQGKVV